MMLETIVRSVKLATLNFELMYLCKMFFVVELTVKKHLKDLNLLPLECLYLNKNALLTVVGPQVCGLY